jgi:adenine-specific DNA-methyltransferase
MPSLNWIGKEAVINHHRQVPYHLLRCDNSLSCGDPDSGNLLVEGDNLLALKALLPYYAGQVKCIYIDPPYNTGNEKWEYNDNVNSPEIRKWLGKVVGGELEDLSRHDKWLCMMYPRLALLKDFLSEDGTIFISIDDTEVANLRLLMDEIFGKINFVINAIWEKKYSPQNDAKGISNGHDHILVYAKNRSFLNINLLPRTEEMNQRYKNPDNDPRGLWKNGDLTSKTLAVGHSYEITCPKTGKIFLPTKGRQWAPSFDTFKRLLNDNRIWFGPKGGNVPALKQFLSEVQNGIVPMSIWKHSEVGHNQEAKQELNTFFKGIDSFETPKPVRLIRRILELATDKDSLILDSFAGSGTTGHSVLDLNKLDGGKRRFILVEIKEDICRNITSQRMAKVIQGYEKENGEKVVKMEGLGGGFRYCKLDKPLFDETGKIGETVKFADLAAHVFFTETGGPIPKRTNGVSPFLGTANGTGYYLLFNGILGDKTPEGGNVLTGKVLAGLPKHNGPKVIFGEGCRLGETRLRREQITFKQLPYEIKVG